MDAMTHFVADQATAEKTAMDLMSTTPSRALDWANQAFLKWMGHATDLATNKAAKVLADPSSNELSKKIAGATEKLAAIGNETKPEKLAEGVLSLMNQPGSSQFLPRRIIADLIGRTETTGALFDRIKAVKTFVQQVREQFRQDVPSTINKQFKTKALASTQRASPLGAQESIDRGAADTEAFCNFSRT